LVVIPTPKEFVAFLGSCVELSIDLTNQQIGLLACKHAAKINLMIACGGLGKVQFGLSTRHLIDCGPTWEWVVCAGAAGGLSKSFSIGDIVVGEETVEYDIRNHFGPPLLPRFPASPPLLVRYQESSARNRWLFNTHFGVIASGDQDVVEEQVRREIVELTKALAVAWEGAGGARACQFSDVPFVEIRGISDKANDDAPSDFEDNVPLVMRNLAEFIIQHNL